MKFTQRLLATATIVAIAVGASAQETNPSDTSQIGGLAFVDEIEVTVVNVDVYVRDSKGEPVHELGVDAFRVYQDGVEMPVSHFAELDEQVIRQRYGSQNLRAPVVADEAGDAVPAPDIKPLWVVLYIDNENIEALQRNRVLRRVREFVVDNLYGPVRMMVVSYQRSLKVVQPFTTESAEVTAALRDMVRLTGGRESRENERQQLLRDIRDTTSRDTGTQRNTQGGARLQIRQEVAAFAAEEANNLSFTLGGLRQVVTMLSGIEGRKSLIYVSSGLPMVPGLGLMHEYAMTFRDQSILSLRGRYDQTRLFHELTALANAQEVSLYSIDASGLDPLEGFDAENAYSRDATAASIGARNYQDSLRYMAQATGGIAVVNTNDVSGGLATITDDLFNYYSLGYTINTSGEDRVHQIKVELTGDRDDDLRFRQRFVEKSRESRVQERVFTSLMVDLDDNPMGLELEAAEAQAGSVTQWVVPMRLDFDLATIALLPEGDELVGRLLLFFGARDDDGRSSEVQRQQREIRMSRDEYEAAPDRRIGLDFRLILGEGRHRVSVGLMDEITRQASYESTSVTVP
jgi:VWFA-related protein